VPRPFQKSPFFVCSNSNEKEEVCLNQCHLILLLVHLLRDKNADRYLTWA